jgi:hypothetical protein
VFTLIATMETSDPVEDTPGWLVFMAASRLAIIARCISATGSALALFRQSNFTKTSPNSESGIVSSYRLSMTGPERVTNFRRAAPNGPSSLRREARPETGSRTPEIPP